MMKNRQIYFIVFTWAILTTLAYAAKVPSPLKEIKLLSSVSLDLATGVYTYTYSISNPPINDGQIFSFDIDIEKPSNGQELSSTGLTIQKGMKATGGMLVRTFEEELSNRLMKKTVIPVGAQPPLNQSFPGWSAGIGGRGTVGWGGSDQNLIGPNQTLEGFILMSYGLPGIRDAEIHPVIDYDNLPDEYWENVELTKKLQDSLVYHIKTIGPTAPPADFKPLAFLSNIVNMKHEAHTLGWIKNDGIVKSLDAKLDNAKADIEKGNTKSAKNILKAFINEVEAQNGKQLTSEAYALLKYNAQYLIDQL